MVFINKLTNFEREYFSILPGKTVRLSKNISKDNPSVLVYAIKKDSFFNPEYIYTIEPKSINALDYYCNDYDIISPESYEIDFKNNIVKFNGETIFDYDHLVIDYMKKDSYAINMMDEMAQYEVSISSDENDIEMYRYDLSGDYDQKTAVIFGEVYRYKGEWKFKPIGEGTTDNSIKEVARRYC